MPKVDKVTPNPGDLIYLDGGGITFFGPYRFIDVNRLENIHTNREIIIREFACYDAKTDHYLHPDGVFCAVAPDFDYTNPEFLAQLLSDIEIDFALGLG